MSRLLLLTLLSVATVAGADDLERPLELGGRTRSYLLHLPAVSAEGALPLVVVLHGAGGDAWLIRDQTSFSEEADWHGFAVAYPNGSRGPNAPGLDFGGRRYLSWNAGACCGWPREQGVDDVGFVRAVVEDVARALPIDRRRVYAAGLSNGGMLAFRLACEASDLFAAVGVVSGALAAPSCAPGAPVSVIQIHGTADEIVPVGGGPGQTLTPAGWVYPSTDAGLERWRELDGCDRLPDDSYRDGVRVRRYLGCRDGAEVRSYVIEDGKHAWFGSGKNALLFPESKEVVATATLWSFFAGHPKP
ncbi:MAG TPA: PHB depolymerase family esterase [Myxococcota bacterium]|nr:PHB depolymerase family esterase [Myxococcota bacterium]